MPRVAELPTCQKTLQAWAPFSSSTTLFEAVTRSDDAWKTNTEFGVPLAVEDQGAGRGDVGGGRVTEGVDAGGQRLAAELVVAGGEGGGGRLSPAAAT